VAVRRALDDLVVFLSGSEVEVVGAVPAGRRRSPG
jgi:hypothetical protein